MRPWMLWLGLPSVITAEFRSATVTSLPLAFA